MNKADNHPISLETVVFIKTLVEAVSDHEPVEGALIPAPDNSLDIRLVPERGERTYGATMRTVLNAEMDKKWPYHVEMVCMAILHADDTLSPEEAHRGVTITAHNVLFGAIREAVLWLTGRQPYGPISLGLSILRPTQLNTPKD